MNHSPQRCTTAAKTPAENNSLSIIILAAGAGRRMKSKGSKSLLQVGRLTLLEYQLQTLWKIYTKAEIVVVTGFQASKLRALCRGTQPARLVYNPNYETTNVMFSVALGLENAISKNILILHGDILFNAAMITSLASGSSKIAVLPTSVKVESEDVGVVIQDNCITNMSYGLPRGWAQMAYFTGKELALFEKMAFNHEMSSNWFFYEGINYVINSGGTFAAHSPANSHWLEINSLNDLQNVQGIIT